MRRMLLPTEVIKSKVSDDKEGVWFQELLQHFKPTIDVFDALTLTFQAVTREGEDDGGVYLSVYGDNNADWFIANQVVTITIRETAPNVYTLYTFQPLYNIETNSWDRHNAIEDVNQFHVHSPYKFDLYVYND